MNPEIVSCSTMRIALPGPICYKEPYAPDQTYAKASPNARIIASNF